jgi:hypothetical protein
VAIYILKKGFFPQNYSFQKYSSIIIFLLTDAYKIHQTIEIIGHVCKNYNVIFQYPNNMEGHVLYMKLDYKMLHTHAPNIQLVVIISQQVTTRAYF